MTRSVHDAHFTALHVAQEARRVGYGSNVVPETRVQQPGKRTRAKADGGDKRDSDAAASSPPIPYERDVLAAALKVLRLHPSVAWVERMNSGKFQLPGKDGKPQWVRFGFKGMADITGQLKDGRRLEVECKRPGEQATPDQAAFLANVRDAGGVAFVACGVDDVMRELA